MRNNANAMCVIPADDAAKEDLEGSESQRGKMKRRDQHRTNMDYGRPSPVAPAGEPNKSQGTVGKKIGSCRL